MEMQRLHALTPVEDPSAHAISGRQQVTDSGAPMRQSCSFAMHRAQQDPAIDGRTQSDWENNQYSTELWLARRWATYPQAPSVRSSDFVFVAFNQSLLCDMRKFFTLRREWAQQVVPFAESLGNSTPVVLANLLGHCSPWIGSRRPSNVRLLHEVCCSPRWPIAPLHFFSPPRRQRCCLRFHRQVTDDSLAVPFVVSSPAWLVRGQDPFAVPWAERKLLFFGGRAPKPSISAVRYRVWQQLRGEPRATSHVHSLWCQHAAGCVSTRELEAHSCHKRVVDAARMGQRCAQDNATLQARRDCDSSPPLIAHRPLPTAHRPPPAAHPLARHGVPPERPSRGVYRRCCKLMRGFPTTRIFARSSHTASASLSAATRTARPS